MKQAFALLALTAAATPLTAQQTVLLDQQPTLGGAVIADAWLGKSAADDFVVSDPSGFTLEDIHFLGGYYIYSTVGVDDFSINIFEDLNGEPGTLVQSYLAQQPTRTFTGLYIQGFHPVDLYEYAFTLPTPVHLAQGTYFVEIYNNTPSTTDAWSWARATADPAATRPGFRESSTSPGVVWNTGTAGGELGMKLLGTGTVVPPVGPNLAIVGACPGAATVSVSGATAGAPIYVASSTALGSYVVPVSACAGTIVGIANPTVRVVLTADAQGGASTAVNVPAAACGNVHVLAFDLLSCLSSNIVAL